MRKLLLIAAVLTGCSTVPREGTLDRLRYDEHKHLARVCILAEHKRAAEERRAVWDNHVAACGRWANNVVKNRY